MRKSSTERASNLQRPAHVAAPDAVVQTLVRYDISTAQQLNQVVVELKMWQKEYGDRNTQGYYDRLQRACSWLAKAKGASDPESRFVFSWIALNALYGVRPEVTKTDWWSNEQRSLPGSEGQQHDDQVPGELDWTLWRICGLDVGCRTLRNLIEDNWDDVKTLIGTRYLMASFWSWKWRDEAELEKWKDSGRRKVKDAIDHTVDRGKMYRGLREIIVWRLRTLRNQIFHGCATDTHSKRRAAGESELEAGSRLLGELVWSFLRLMATETGQKAYWPPSPYPRTGSPQHQRFDRSWLPAASARTMR
jgi:hypothetical protein